MEDSEEQQTYPTEEQEQTVPTEEENSSKPTSNEDNQPSSYEPESSNDNPKDSNDLLDPKTIMTNTDYVPSSSMQVENVRFHSFKM